MSVAKSKGIIVMFRRRSLLLPVPMLPLMNIAIVVLLALFTAGAMLSAAPATAQEPAASTRIFLPLLRGPTGVPVVNSFSSSATTVAPGSDVTLRWNVSGAVRVRIEPGIGDVSDRTSITVRPAATTTYTLIATGPAGERRAGVTVTVNATQPTPPAGAFFLPGQAPTRNFVAAYDGTGALHLAFVRHTRTPDLHELLYGRCERNADCDSFTNWQTVVIHSGNIGSVQLEVTPNGRPRLAIQDEYTVTSVRLAYMACERTCLNADNWQGIALDRGLSFGGAFLQHTDQRWFAIDGNGLPHMLVSTQQGSFYLSCRRECATSGAGWSVTPLDTTGDPFLTTQLFNPVLQVSADGQPHVLGTISSPELVYLSCTDDCAEASNWSLLVLANYNQPAISDRIPMAVNALELDMELERGGGVVVAFGGLTPGIDAPSRAYLLRCAAQCTEADNWNGRAFTNTPAFGLNMQLDHQDQPFWLLASAVSEQGERIVELATCTTGDCYAPNSNWQARVISRSGEMEAEMPIKNAIATPPVCSIATTNWEHAANQLLFTPNGELRLLSNAVGTSICRPGMDEWIDQWGTKKRGRTIDVWVITARARWNIVP